MTINLHYWRGGWRGGLLLRMRRQLVDWRVMTQKLPDQGEDNVEGLVAQGGLVTNRTRRHYHIPGRWGGLVRRNGRLVILLLWLFAYVVFWKSPLSISYFTFLHIPYTRYVHVEYMDMGGIIPTYTSYDALNRVLLTIIHHIFLTHHQIPCSTSIDDSLHVLIFGNNHYPSVYSHSFISPYTRCVHVE